jgi:hypothetical protein
MNARILPVSLANFGLDDLGIVSPHSGGRASILD